MSKTQMINCCCESNFAALYWRVAKNGKSMAISTLIDLQQIFRKLKNNNPSCLAAQYKWTRSSEEAKKVNSSE